MLCELSSSRADEPLDAMLEKALGRRARESAGSPMRAVAQSDREREAFWRLRESIPEAQRKDGASLKHDISVPVSQVPRFIERRRRLGGADTFRRACWSSYGHLGDGNLHFNINQRAGHPGRAAAGRGAEGEARHPRLRAGVRRQLFSAEHGIGQLKVFELERYANPVELDLMQRIKHALDPNGIMNPGKVLRP